MPAATQATRVGITAPKTNVIPIEWQDESGAEQGKEQVKSNCFLSAGKRGRQRDAEQQRANKGHSAFQNRMRLRSGALQHGA